MSHLRAQHDETVGDEIDAAIATEQAELRSQMASFESRELAQIESASTKFVTAAMAAASRAMSRSRRCG